MHVVLWPQFYWLAAWGFMPAKYVVKVLSLSLPSVPWIHSLWRLLKQILMFPLKKMRSRQFFFKSNFSSFLSLFNFFFHLHALFFLFSSSPCYNQECGSILIVSQSGSKKMYGSGSTSLRLTTIAFWIKNTPLFFQQKRRLIITFVLPLSIIHIAILDYFSNFRAE